MTEPEHKIGEALSDGRMYAGLSPTTGDRMYINVHGFTEMTAEDARAAKDNLSQLGWDLPITADDFKVRLREFHKTESARRSTNPNVYFGPS